MKKAKRKHNKSKHKSTAFDKSPARLRSEIASQRVPMPLEMAKQRFLSRRSG